MAESNKNYFATLPDEIVLKIQENMEGLTDISNMAQVSHRFNRLANEVTRRRSIFISEEEFEVFSKDTSIKYSCIDKLLKEIKDSESFESLRIKLPMSVNEDLNVKELLVMIEEDTTNFLSNYTAHCRFYTSINLTYAMIFFTPRCNGADYGRTLRYHPTNTTSLKFTGKDFMMLEKIVNNCKETLLEFSFEGEITLALFTLLSKCKKLLNLILRGKFNLTNDVNETDLPQIASKVVLLSAFELVGIRVESAYMIRDIFLADALHSLEIDISLLSGVETEICSRCPNLRYLKITFASRLSNDVFSDFCDNLLMHLNNHLFIYEVLFCDIDISSTLRTILSASTIRNLTVNYTLYDEILYCLRFTGRIGWRFPPMVLKHNSRIQ